MPLVVGVLAEAIGRVREGDDHVRDLEPVDQVVEHDAHVREVHVVAAVVDDEQRVEARLAEARRQVDRAVAHAVERLRVERERLEQAGARIGIGRDPVRDLVALALEHRVRAERIARAIRDSGDPRSTGCCPAGESRTCILHATREGYRA